MAVAVVLASGAAFAGDSASGQKVYKKKCKMCHTTEQGGKQKMGPNLFGIMGAKAGATDYAKYKSVDKLDLVWDADNMDKFLAAPDEFAGGKTKMKPTKKAEDRADLITYMMTFK
jgi:cytochrome c